MSGGSAGRTVLLLGGSSDIGLAIVARLAADGVTRAVLAARDPDALRARLATAAGPPLADMVAVERWDALDSGGHEAFLDRVAATHGRPDVVVCAVGALGHHAGAGMAPADADALLRANLVGPATAVLAAGRHLAAAGGGAVVVLSSIAGVRTRRSNFVYGGAKAGLDGFALGLGDALVDRGVTVHVVRPGFVHSRMTAGLRPAPFATDPAGVAEVVAASLRAGRGGAVFVPRFARLIFAVIGRLPRPWWRRLVGDR